jgi:hypothetical protein
MESTSKSNSFCISVDGSEFSDYAFDLVLNELYQKKDKIFIFHIANPTKSSEIPYNFKPDVISSKYDSKLTGKLNKGDFQVIVKDRDEKSAHALQQVYQLATEKNGSILVLGFKGHKATADNDLTKGVNFVINNIKLPTIVVKENLQRSKKGSFNWLCSIEQANSRSFKAMEFSLNYIDKSKDQVIGLHITLYGESHAEEIKTYFENTCQENGVINYNFITIDKENSVSIGKAIANYANFSEIPIDFLVLGHNPNKYEQKDVSPAFDVINSAQCNILFYS